MCNKFCGLPLGLVAIGPHTLKVGRRSARAPDTTERNLFVALFLMGTLTGGDIEHAALATLLCTGKSARLQFEKRVVNFGGWGLQNVKLSSTLGVGWGSKCEIVFNFER